MLGWLLVIVILLCSCIGAGDADSPPAGVGPPATEADLRAVGTQASEDPNPCLTACGLAATEGCVGVSAQCADGGWPLFAVVGGIGLLCSEAMQAACDGPTGLSTCQQACPK